MENTQTQLDPEAVNLAKAIRQSESGGNFQARGKSGEYGAYQFTKPTWEGASKKYGVNVPLEQATPEQQNEVAYKQIKEWKDKGYNVGEIASMWNAGESRPNAYLENHKGTNKYGVSYDTPTYAKSVATAYHTIKNGGDIVVDSTNPSAVDYQGADENGYITKTVPAPITDQTKISDKTSQDGNVITDIKKRGEELGNATSSIVGGREKTGQSRLSGVIQAGGALAGVLGDVVGRGLELIPGVKQVENLIGEGIGTLAQTEVGQAVAKSIKEFSEEHPELSKDIGAGFNIVTAIPILKGLKVFGKLGVEAGSNALKNVAEKSFISGAPEVIGTTQKATKLLSKNPNVFKDMVDRRLVGDIKGGVYTTGDSVNQSWNTIKKANSEVNSVLKKTYANKYTFGAEDTDTILKRTLNEFPNSKFTEQNVLNNGRKLTPQNGKLWDKFEQGNASLEDINKLRSDLDTAVKSVYTSISQPPIRKELGKTLADSMRTFVKEQAPETVPLFDEMSTQFDIQKALSLMEGKAIKPGGVAKFAGHTLGIGTGGAVGGLIGGPTGAVIGGLVGEKTAGTVAKKVAGQNITRGILKRTGENAVKVSKKEIKRKLPGLFAGSLNTNP